MELPGYAQQQHIPGVTGGINDLVRALMGGVGKAQARPTSPGPVQAPLDLTLSASNPTPSPVPPQWGPTAGVPYTGQAMGINGPGPMGPLLYQPPGY